MMLIGDARFPDDPSVADLEPAAREAARRGAFADDAILFGKWRD
jgi:hypothetical protein